MRDYEPSYCDDMDLSSRSMQIRDDILPGLEIATNGEISLAGFLSTKGILDVGCGRGALADALRKFGYMGSLIGVDRFAPYDGRNAYHEYAELIDEDIRAPQALERANKHPYDTVFALGLPRQAVKFILENRNSFHQGGKNRVIVFTDDVHSLPGGFNLYHGIHIVDKNIFISK